MKDYKILFSDLDGTLIETVSKKTFAEDVTDFRIRKAVLDKIRTMEGLRFIFIVTNQGGIPNTYQRKTLRRNLTAFRHSFTHILTLMSWMKMMSGSAMPIVRLWIRAIPCVSPTLECSKVSCLMNYVMPQVG